MNYRRKGTNLRSRLKGSETQVAFLNGEEEKLEGIKYCHFKN